MRSHVQIHTLAQELQAVYIKTWPSAKLTGACLMASLDLHASLTRRGIKARVVKGQVLYRQRRFAHYWLEVDGWVWDITACQFDLDPICFPCDQKANYNYHTNLYLLDLPQVVI